MSYDILFKRALDLHEAGRFEEAEQIYRQILETAPEQPEVLNLLGLIAQVKGVQTEACELFYKAIKADPARAPFYYNMGFSLKLDNKPREALTCFQKVLELQPEIADAHNEIALIYESLQNIEEARANWKKALEINPDLASAKINLARSYRMENTSVAIAELEKAVEIFPEEAQGWYYLSQLYLDKKQMEKAWSAAIKAKELAPASDEVRVILGQLSLIDSKPDNARIYFEKALLLNNRNIEALLASANLAAQNNEYETAEARYKRILELEPKNFDAHHNYADLLYKTERKLEALEEYRQAVILNPNSAEVSNNLGIILRDSGELEQAIGLFGNAFKHNPNMEEISINLAETITLYAAGKPEKAVKIAETWVKAAPENIFANHVLSALKGERSADNQIYSEKLFDHFADNYELVVKNINYTAPVAMGRIAGSLETTVVDLGCGTGLLGEIIKSSRNHLTGVDLSQKMLDAAQEKGIYDKLVKSDAIKFLESNPKFDWVTAADVLGYMGDLEHLFKAAAGSSLLFSTEINDGTEDYKLGISGRYRHHSDYVERLLKENGYQKIYKEELVLRYENGIPVKGMVWKAE